MTDNLFIGKSIPRVDGREKVTGEAIFTTDIYLPRMLFGKIKVSPHPFAKVISVNTERAKKLSGVFAIITAKDVTQFPYGIAIPDELALADEYVRYIGDPIAGVAAVNEETAEEALDLIEVDYEELTPVLDIDEATKDGAPNIHPERADVKHNIAYHFDFVRGAGEAAFKQADIVVEDRFSTQAQYQAYLEPQACIAQWDSSGRLTIWASNQQPFRIREALAKALGIPEHQIRVIRPYIGGAFGGKLYLRPHYVISSFLSRETGRPVKITYTREEDFIACRPRLSEHIELKLGFKKDGTFIAKSIAITADAGAYCDSSPYVVKVSMTNPGNIYRIANIKAEAKVIYTNKSPRTAFRGFGAPEALFAMESLMDVATEKLGIDPMELRLKNCSQKGDITAHGWILNSCGLGESIRTAAKKSDWKKKRKDRPRNHGIGMACQTHVSNQRFLHPAFDGSAAIIHIDQHGKVKVISGETEIGQGSLTIFAQIAAEELGANIEDVEVLPFVDSDISPYSIGTHASRVTAMGGNAVLKAAQDAKKQLLQYAAGKLGISADALEIKNGKLYTKGTIQEQVITIPEIAYDIVFRKQGGAPIIGRGEYTVPDYVVIPDTSRYGNCSIGYAFSTQVAEVEVDAETGKINVLDVWVGEDLGRALNPKLCEGQIEGGVVQGVGYALTENVYWRNGKILNHNFHDYKIPAFTGIPRIHSYFIETNEPEGPYGAKSLAEAALNPTAAAIANAIYNAVGVRIKNLPITPEKILRALKDRNEKAEIANGKA